MLAILFSILFLGFTNLVATNLLANEGVKVSHVSDQTTALIKDNQYLFNELSHARSLALIESKAKELGFTRSYEVAIIGSTETVAQLPVR